MVFEIYGVNKATSTSGRKEETIKTFNTKEEAQEYIRDQYGVRKSSGQLLPYEDKFTGSVIRRFGYDSGGIREVETPTGTVIVSGPAGSSGDKRRPDYEASLAKAQALGQINRQIQSSSGSEREELIRQRQEISKTSVSDVQRRINEAREAERVTNTPTTSEEIRQSLFTRQQDIQRQEIQSDLYRRQGESISRDIERNPPRTAAEIIAAQRSLPSQFQTPETQRAIAVYSSDVQAQSNKEVYGPSTPKEIFGPPVPSPSQKFFSNIKAKIPDSVKQGVGIITYPVTQSAKGITTYAAPKLVGAAEFFSFKKEELSAKATEAYSRSIAPSFGTSAPDYVPSNEPFRSEIYTNGNKNKPNVPNQDPNSIGVNVQGNPSKVEKFINFAKGSAYQIGSTAAELGEFVTKKPGEALATSVFLGAAGKGVSLGVVGGTETIRFADAPQGQGVRTLIGDVGVLGVGYAIAKPTAKAAQKVSFSQPAQKLRTALGFSKVKRDFEVQELVQGTVTKDVEVEPVIPTTQKQIKTITEISPEIRTRISRRTTEPRVQKTINVVAKETDIKLDPLKEGDTFVERSTVKGLGQISTSKLKENFNKFNTGFTNFFKFSSKRQEPKRELEVFETPEAPESFSFLKFSEIGKQNKRTFDIVEGPEVRIVDFRGQIPKGLTARGRADIGPSTPNERYIELPKSSSRRRKSNITSTLRHELIHVFDPITRQGARAKIRNLLDNYVTRRSEKDLVKLTYESILPKNPSLKERRVAKKVAKSIVASELGPYRKSQYAIEARARIAENFPKEISFPKTKTGKELSSEIKKTSLKVTGIGKGEILRPKQIEVPVKADVKKVLSKRFESTKPDIKNEFNSLGLKRTSELRLQPVRLRREYKGSVPKITKASKNRRKVINLRGRESDDRLVGITQSNKGYSPVVQSEQQLRALEVFKQQQSVKKVPSQAPLVSVSQRPEFRSFKPIVGFKPVTKTKLPFTLEFIKTNNLPKESLKSNVKPISGFDTKLTPSLKISSLPDTKKINEFKPVTKEKPLLNIKPRIDFSVKQTPSTKLTPSLKIDQNIIPVTKPKLDISPRKPDKPRIPPPRIPRTPPVLKPTLDFNKRIIVYKQPKLKKQKRKFGYTPSLIASTFGIRGKAPKNLSGIEIRPLPRRK